MIPQNRKQWLEGQKAREGQKTRPPDNVIYPIPIEKGGTGATTPEEARANLGVSGGGTVSYADLTNKPQIAGNTLSGNVSLATLGAIPAAEKGANNGVATLDGTGKIPSTQLPASVYEAAAAAAQSAEDAARYAEGAEEAKEAILGVFEGSY